MELAYIALAAVAINHPILLPRSADAHLKEVKGGFNTVFILWQTLALLPANDIIGFMYSGEWSHVAREDAGDVRPGHTDRVSTLTSGWLDRIKHVLTRVASPAFRTCLITAIHALALAAIAPGAVSVATVIVDIPTTLDVGKLTIRGDASTPDLSVPPSQAATQRATVFVRVEQLQQGTYGFTTDSNAIVAWPPRTLLTAQIAATYQSDIIRYKHSCSWHVPIWHLGNGTSSAIEDNLSSWSVAEYPQYNWITFTQYTPTQVAAGWSRRHLSLPVWFADALPIVPRHLPIVSICRRRRHHGKCLSLPVPWRR